MRFSPRFAPAALVCTFAAGALFVPFSRAQEGATTSVSVRVPASLRSSPFDIPRTLRVPSGFAVSLVARIPAARFLALAPNGDVLVSVPREKKIRLIRRDESGAATVFDFATDLRNPHDMVFHTVEGTTYLYVAESHQISRSVYVPGDMSLRPRQIIIRNLPDNSSDELRGSYGHQLKNIALDGNNKLYLSIASATNADPSDTTSDPVRCAIYQYNADGTGGRLFARGLRNAEGLAILPGTNTLWVTVNNRDSLPYPFRGDFDGDGSDDYGKVMAAYVDNHPPEEFTSVQLGANYGWPFANPNPDTSAGMNKPPFDPDFNNNPDWSRFPQSDFTRVDKGIQAHSAPLGFSFLQNSNFAPAYRNGAVLAYHGSWNRRERTGYKIAYFPWDGATQLPGDERDLVAGWLQNGSVWGRPVDVIPDRNNNLLISDDQAGAIYSLHPAVEPPAPTPGNGTGLRGEYFGGKNLTPLVKTQTDPQIDFAFDTGGPRNLDGTPMSSVGSDNFSIRWTGQVQAIEAGTYTFSVTADDGVRLWLDGVNSAPRIDKWGTQSATTHSTSYEMAAGQKINLKMEYFDATGRATARLWWQRPGQSTAQIVPQSQLYPAFGLYNRARGGTATASYSLAAGQQASRAFDNDGGTKWLGYLEENGGWLCYQFGGNVRHAVSRYEIVNAHNNAERNPKNWLFQGSDDGSNWTTLDSRANQSWSGRFITKSFAVSNPARFNRYRLLFSATSGALEESGSGYVGSVEVAEFRLLAP